MHTPGPWIIGARPYTVPLEHATPERPKVFECWVTTESGRLLAKVGVLTGGPHDGPTEANAELIAAAPDLLEALGDLIDAIFFAVPPVVGSPMGPGQERLQDAMGDAIDLRNRLGH